MGRKRLVPFEDDRVAPSDRQAAPCDEVMEAVEDINTVAATFFLPEEEKTAQRNALAEYSSRSKHMEAATSLRIACRSG